MDAILTETCNMPFFGRFVVGLGYLVLIGACLALMWYVSWLIATIYENNRKIKEIQRQLRNKR